MISTTFRGKQYTFETKPGLFSKEKIDKGSSLLLNSLHVKETDICLDLGCGYGALGIIVAEQAKQGSVWMVDVDMRAIKYSQINADINKVHNSMVIASDGFEKIPFAQKFNIIISNPPTHAPKETIVEFIEGAKQHLLPGGKLSFVTESRISPMIKREFLRAFSNYQVVTKDNTYIVSQAIQDTV